ncbi:MAG TPA: multicopper oxidase domain-containing protein [Candidatus Cybelea sp.]
MMLRTLGFFLLCCAPALAVQRTYYIAADEAVWNYAPGGTNVLTGERLKPNKSQLGYAYRKILYHGYTDSTFSVQQTRNAGEQYMGLLGPVIRAVVGDSVVVVFRNNSHLPLSFHVHGLRYLKTSEGAPYRDGSGVLDKPGDAVAPGATYTYHFDVPERSGPGPMDQSSILWMYHSHTDELRDVNTGLVGPIVVTRRGAARDDGSPSDIDREVFTMFAQFDESQSRLFAENVADRAINPRGLKPGPSQFVDDNTMFSINGYIFGNMPLVDVHRGQRTRWYVMSTMSDFDFHAPHWHGETVTINGMRTDTAELGPMGMIVADMIPDDPGVWLYHCHLNIHLEAGMVARFRTLP